MRKIATEFSFKHPILEPYTVIYSDCVLALSIWNQSVEPYTVIYSDCEYITVRTLVPHNGSSETEFPKITCLLNKWCCILMASFRQKDYLKIFW